MPHQIGKRRLAVLQCQDGDGPACVELLPYSCLRRLIRFGAVPAGDFQILYTLLLQIAGKSFFVDFQAVDTRKTGTQIRFQLHAQRDILMPCQLLPGFRAGCTPPLVQSEIDAAVRSRHSRAAAKLHPAVVGKPFLAAAECPFDLEIRKFLAHWITAFFLWDCCLQQQFPGYPYSVAYPEGSCCLPIRRRLSGNPYRVPRRLFPAAPEALRPGRRTVPARHCHSRPEKDSPPAVPDIS